MAKPQTVREARVNVDARMRDLDVAQRHLVERLHELVLRIYETSDSRLFAIARYEPDVAARAAMTIIFRQAQLLQLGAQWVANYLWCKEEDVPVYEATAKEVIRLRPNDPFTRKLKIVCEGAHVKFEDLTT